MAYIKSILPTYLTIDAVAAAVIAYRLNGQMVSHDGTENKANKTIVLEILNGQPTFSHADLDEAQDVITAVTGLATMSLLSGKNISDFTLAVAKMLSEDHVTDISALVYAPNIYQSVKKRESIEEKIEQAKYSSRPLGKAGDKIRVDFKLIDSKYVQSINCFSAIGIDDQGNLVSFLTPKEELCRSQIIEGKIKTVGESNYHHGAIVTGLSFVKVAK